MKLAPKNTAIISSPAPEICRFVVIYVTTAIYRIMLIKCLCHKKFLHGKMESCCQLMMQRKDLTSLITRIKVRFMNGDKPSDFKDRAKPSQFKILDNSADSDSSESE